MEQREAQAGIEPEGLCILFRAAYRRYVLAKENTYVLVQVHKLGKFEHVCYALDEFTKDFSERDAASRSCFWSALEHRMYGC